VRARTSLEGAWCWVAAPYVIFCLALGLRLWGLSFGLPYVLAADEGFKRDDALHLAEARFLHRNSQPSFLYNSLYLIFRLAGLVSSQWTPAEYHYMGRLWIAVLGALTTVALFRLGSLWDRRLGSLAAVLLAVLPLHTTASRYIKEDVPLALMTTVTLLFIVAHLTSASRSSLFGAALFAGFSASTKYSGLLLVPPLVAAAVVEARRRRATIGRMAADLGLIVLGVCVGFFLISPVYLVHPGRLLSGLLGQWQYARGGHHDGIAIDPWQHLWTYYVRTGLIPGMTWPVFALAAAGLARMPRMRDGWVVTATVAWLYLVFEHGRAKPYPFSARYLLPMVPLLCLSAAQAVIALTDVMRRRVPPWIAYSVCGLIAVVPPLIKSAVIADEAAHDTRLAAGAWMEQAMPRGAWLVISEPMMYLPSSRYWDTEWRVITPDRLADLVPIRRPDDLPYVIISSFTYQRYLDSPNAVPWKARFYTRIMQDYRLVKEFRPRWLTYGFHSPIIRIYQPRVQTRESSRDSGATRAPERGARRPPDGDR